MSGGWPPGPTPSGGLTLPITVATPAAGQDALPIGILGKDGGVGTAAAAATGTITWAASNSLTVGQHFTVTDALGGVVTFQIGLSTDMSGGNPFILPLVGQGWTAAQTASNTVNAFGFAGCGLDTSSSALGAVTTITDLTTGAAGNVAITSNVSTAGFAVTGMSGGVTGVTGGNGTTITLTPGAAGSNGGTVGTVQIAGAATVTGALTAAGGVIGNATTATTASGVAPGSVGTAGLADGAVTTAKLATTGVSAATYGSSTQVAVLAIGVDGRVTSASNTAIALPASAITSGALTSQLGGTGQNFGATTGRPKISGGVFSTAPIDLTTEVSGTLPISSGGTGSGTKNFVDLSTDQTVGGNKTFSNTIIGSISGNAATASSVAPNGVTAAAIAPTSLRFLGGIGLAAAGPVTLTGAKVGDSVTGVVGTVSGTISSFFETTITVNNQIQMTSGSIVGEKLFVLLIAKGG